MIKINNITKVFDNNIVLNNINEKFEDGKIYGIVGRNGCGKSVLLKIICGFMKPDRGSIIFDDIDINKEETFPPETGALLENGGFIPNLSGFDNLKLLASINNIISEKEIMEHLRIVNLESEMKKKYYKYSLGMRKKLGICQAIMENQKYIILDEPFNGIDSESLIMIKKHLISLKKKKKIIIISTHIEEDINNLCDIVFKIENGSLKKIK